MENLLVSVVISAASTKEAFFESAIYSVLRQSLSDFELIVVDDGLSEENRSFIHGLVDPRVNVITNETNIGQSKSVNKALKQARGTYVIRMDADDVMLPTRIADQVAYMECHPEVIVAGALAIQSDNKRIIPRVYPTAECFAMGLLFSSDMVHPTAIIRREMALERGLWYDEDFLYSQDYKLWVDALDRGEIGLLKKPVLIYRVHPGQINNTKSTERPAYSKRARQQAFTHFGVDLTDEEVDGLFFFANDDDAHDFAICRLLKDKCHKAMESDTYILFEREISFRIFKAGMRYISRKHSLRVLACTEFWKALLSFWYWPFYFRSLQFKKDDGASIRQDFMA